MAGYSFLAAPVAIGVILPSLFIPWISINILGYESFSPTDVLAELAGSSSDSEKATALDTSLRSTIFSYGNSYLFVTSMFLYLAAIAGMCLSIAWRSKRILVSLVAGILAVSSGLLWHYSIESLKSNFIQVVSLTGGIIGEEFRGQERILADQFFVLGMGHYMTMLAGGVSILGFISGSISESVLMRAAKRGLVGDESTRNTSSNQAF